MKFLGCLACLFLTLLDFVKFLSKMVTLIYIPTGHALNSQSSTSCQVLVLSDLIFFFFVNRMFVKYLLWLNFSLPITKGTEHLFTHLWAVYIKFVFCKVPVYVLCWNFHWVVFFSLVYVKDTSPFLTIYIADIFSYSVAYLFKFLFMSFDEQNLFQCSYIFLHCLCF